MADAMSHLLARQLRFQKFEVMLVIQSLRGNIHTQAVTLNVKMTFGGWGLLTLTLELWQNDIFLILM